MGDMIDTDTFKITTLVVNQKFYRKSWIEASVCHSHLEKLIHLSIMFLGYSNKQPTVWDNTTVNNAKNNLPSTLSQFQNVDLWSMAF